MEMNEIQMLIPTAAAISAIGGAWLNIRKIAKDAKKDKKEQSAEILQEAKEEMAIMRAQLEAKINSVKSDLKNLEANVEKDMNHLRETYNGEIRFLGQKIEELRSEVRNQHGQLVQLLTKMIDKSNG